MRCFLLLSDQESEAGSLRAAACRWEEVAWRDESSVARLPHDCSPAHRGDTTVFLHQVCVCVCFPSPSNHCVPSYFQPGQFFAHGHMFS